MVEWARFEMTEGTGLPQDGSGNARHFTSLGDYTWTTFGGHTCIGNDAGGDRAEFGGEGYAPIGGAAIRIQMAITGTGGNAELIDNAGGSGTTQVTLAFDDFGGGPFPILGISNGVSGDNGFWNGNSFAIDTVVDFLVYYRDDGSKGVIFYDPADRTTVIGSSTGTNAGGYLTSGATEIDHVRLQANSDRDFRVIDLTLYEDGEGGEPEPIEGTAAFTGTGGTFDAEGSPVITGTLSTTGTGGTFAAQGAPIITGTGAFVGTGGTLAATGSPVITGTGAFVGSGGTFSATDYAVITGTAAFAGTGGTFAAIGTPVITGAASFTGTGGAFQATGTTTITGTAAFAGSGGVFRAYEVAPAIPASIALSLAGPRGSMALRGTRATVALSGSSSTTIITP